ncbi:transglycosylase SLT domain-containing protein [Acinetobacter soli]|uniref:transglycosylase SLT domain-containing protein n=1 Tax=Acinetobacter soli TaxID=487316 RepID=UPI002FF3269B
MSNWLSGITSDEQQQIDALNEKGITGKDTRPKDGPNIFSGSIDAPLRGAAAGFAKIGDVVAKPFDLAGDAVSYAVDSITQDEIAPFSEYRAKAQKQRDDLVYQTIEALEDKNNTGAVGRFLYGAGDYLFRGGVGAAAGGVGGAAILTGGTTGNYVYNDLTRKGVDDGTALQVAGVNAVGDAVATALPLSYGYRGAGGLARDFFASVGGATALSTGMQFTSGEVLKSEGYSDQAKQYEVTGETIATDIVLNALMFGGARWLGNRQAKLDQAVDIEINQLNADQLEMRQDAIHETLVRNEMEFEDTILPVLTDSPVEINNHYRNLDAATDQILNGQTVNVPTSVKGEEKLKPVTISPSEYKSIRYDDPRLDALLGNKARSMHMEWAVPLLTAVRRAGEKSHNNQVSPKGAQSIMQIMPETQVGLERTYNKKWDINNPEHATEMALYLVREMSEQYKTKDPFVLAAHYNGGFANGKAMQKNGKPKAAETIKYVNRVKDFINTGKYKNYTGNNISTAMGMDGSSYQFSYEIKDLNDLIASNDQLYGINPAYPAELQPRDRTREASRQQIEDMAADLKPEWLGESPMLSNGAPIIGLDNVVESGNGRTLAIGKAYENGRADAYREYVQNWANERGMDISGVNQPVLVRTRLSDVNRVEFARLANESDVAQMSASERARTDADRLPDASMLKTNSDGSLNIDSSMDFIRGFVDQLPQSERGAVITSDGRLSQEGKRRIESAIAQRAYDDPNLIARLAENIDDTSKNVLNALLRNAPNLAQLNDLVRQGGRFENTIAQDLAQAAQKLYDLKANDVQVRDYLNQNQLIDDGLSDGARRFLEVFDQNSKSAKAISQSIADEIQAIESMGDPRQGSLFGDTPEGKAALDVIYSNPDMPVSRSRTGADGQPEEYTTTMREYLADLEAEAKQADLDTLAAQTALNCALQFG